MSSRRTQSSRPSVSPASSPSTRPAAPGGGRPAGATDTYPDSTGRRLAGLGPTGQSLRVWELGGLPGATPLELRRSGRWYDPGFAFHPNGDWGVATTHVAQRLTLWPLRRPIASVIEAYDFSHYRKPLAFNPDGQWLATGWVEGLRLLPVEGGDLSTMREIRLPKPRTVYDVRFDPEGRHVFVISAGVDAWVVPIDGRPAREVIPAVDNHQIEQGAISPSGARVASGYFLGEGPFTLSVADLASGVTTTFDLPVPEGHSSGYPGGVNSLDFLDEQTLLTMGWGGLRRWDLTTGTQELLAENDGRRWMDLSRTTGIVVAWAIRADIAPSLELIELATGSSRPLEGFGGDVAWADVDPSGSVLATGCADGTVRVGRLDGGEPHLLPGHIGNVTNVAVSPDLRWVASAGEDNTLRLWPMPDLTKPPLHTLPHDELLAKLRSLTNLRAVRDPASDTGWTIELAPFPGWRDVPTW
jgi:WD40 repeat protein